MGLPKAVQDSEFLDHTVPTDGMDREAAFTIVGDQQSGDLADGTAQQAAHAVFEEGVAAHVLAFASQALEIDGAT